MMIGKQAVSLETILVDDNKLCQVISNVRRKYNVIQIDPISRRHLVNHQIN